MDDFCFSIVSSSLVWSLDMSSLLCSSQYSCRYRMHTWTHIQLGIIVIQYIAYDILKNSRKKRNMKVETLIIYRWISKMVWVLFRNGCYHIFFNRSGSTFKLLKQRSIMTHIIFSKGPKVLTYWTLIQLLVIEYPNEASDSKIMLYARSYTN